VVCTHDPAGVAAAADAAGVAARTLGRAGGDRMVVEDLLDVGLGDAARAARGALVDDDD